MLIADFLFGSSSTRRAGLPPTNILCSGYCRATPSSSLNTQECSATLLFVKQYHRLLVVAQPPIRQLLLDQLVEPVVLALQRRLAAQHVERHVQPQHPPGDD